MKVLIMQILQSSGFLHPSHIQIFTSVFHSETSSSYIIVTVFFFFFPRIRPGLACSLLLKFSRTLVPPFQLWEPYVFRCPIGLHVFF
jgi:hypothetical protein